MNTKTVTAQNGSLFEIDAELEEAFDQLQLEREIHDGQRSTSVSKSHTRSTGAGITVSLRTSIMAGRPCRPGGADGLRRG